MSNKRTKKIIVVSTIVVVIVISAIVIVGNEFTKQKNKIAEYDSYADVIEDYSFVLGCQNTVKHSHYLVNGQSR